MSKKTVNAWAIKEKGKALEPFSYELPPIGLEQVDIKVLYCGICHSDLSMIQNDWGNTTYPLVPGHEIVGEVIELGSQVKNLKVGDAHLYLRNDCFIISTSYGWSPEFFPNSERYI